MCLSPFWVPGIAESKEETQCSYFPRAAEHKTSKLEYTFGERWNAAQKDKMEHMKGQLRLRRTSQNFKERLEREEMLEDTKASDFSDILKGRLFGFREQTTSMVKLFLNEN